MKKISLLFLFSLFFSCESSIENKIDTILIGKISNPRSKEIGVILFDNFITRDNFKQSVAIDDSGEFKLVLLLENPQYALLSRPTSNHPLFLYPGDSLFITFNDEKVTSTLQFKGITSGNNNFLSEFNKKYNMSNHFAVMREKDPQEFKRYMMKVKKEELLLFNEYSSKYELKNDFREFALAMIDYQFYLLMFMYRGMYAQSQQMPADSIKLPSDYYDFINEKDFNNHAALINADDYLNAVSAYVRFKLHSTKINSYDEYCKVEYKFAKENLEGKTRDYFLAKQLAYRIIFTNTMDEELYQDYMNSCNSANVKEILIKTNERRIAIQKLIGSEFPKEVLQSKVFTKDNDEIKFSDMLDTFRNKIIYLDLWSFECGPCIKEMPYSRKLIEKFQNKSIEFIFLSIDESHETWLKGIEFSNVSNGHYRLERGFNSEFMKVLNIKGIPRYILIDEQGKILQLDAKRPSSKELIDEIEKLLSS